MDSIRIALAQINPTVGDVRGNADRIIAYARNAAALGAGIVAFPELALSGYHPRDLLASRGFLNACSLELKRVWESVPEITMLVGLPLLESSATNAAAVCSGGLMRGAFHKKHMPGLGTLDESRYFQTASELGLIKFADKLIGVNLREDLWYLEGPAERQCSAGASLIINMSAWPYVSGRSGHTEHLASSFASRCSTPVAFVNMAGASDELIFEGASLVVGADGKTIARARNFVEDLLVVDVPLETSAEAGQIKDDVRVIQLTEPANDKPLPTIPEREIPEPMAPEHALYSALATALVDLVEKGGYKGVMLVMSGGLASDLAACMAADSIGSASVHALIADGRWAPSAKGCAELLGINTVEAPSMSAGMRELGAALMDESVALGLLPISSISKSDLASGGITLYAETAGLFAPLKDLWGPDVLRLSAWRNSMGEVIPREAIEVASKPNPEEAALKVLIEDDLGFEEAMKVGEIGPAGLEELLARIQGAEALRRQSPPGPKVTQKAIGLEWALPLVARFMPNL
ncbi:MAG: hypothetical protein KAR83_00275 [Thermodesulfovibrionales bacterium]|nr:hypothetical protein [Thermodesulfovibrionales bacterium]